jgi:type I restriction enzyme R subunit
VLKAKIGDLLSTTLAGVASQMRSREEIVNSIFFVINKQAISSLDGVGVYVKNAFSTLYGKQPTIVDKFVAFNLLVTKFEAYLKKLYYLVKGTEVPAQDPEHGASWRDVIYSLKPLWNLKYSSDAAMQQLYQSLQMVKTWRNDESHISPTASEQDVDAAISIIITMYAYATGSMITDLEMAGHDVDIDPTDNDAHGNTNILTTYQFPENASDERLAAEPLSVKDLPEEKRVDILKKCISQLLGYNPKKSVFSKQRHWESIYRVAADYGFVIDGDYQFFKDIVDRMAIQNLPGTLSVGLVKRLNSGVYEKSLEDWTSEGLTGRSLQEFEDIQQCAKAFEQIVKESIPTNR